MKITFLGSSHGVPSAERFCSSAMIETGDRFYLIDAGAPVIDLLLRRGMDLNALKALFTTHFHGDHVDGILSLADLANWYFKTMSFDLYLTEERGIRLFTELIEAVEGSPLDRERLRFRMMTEAGYRDERISLTPIPTCHLRDSGRPAWGYLVRAEGKTALFTGDLSYMLRYGDFPLPKEKVDLVISEMAHFGIPEVEPYLAKLKTDRLLFSHVFPLDKLEAIPALSGKYGYPVEIARDEDVIVL